MLSPADDYPIHQIAEVIRHTGTSDRNFYDRYYFNLFPLSGDLFAVFGMGQYPNLGTTDAFLCVTRNNIHRVVRASRELGADRMDTSVGPLRVEVLEGLKRLRVVLEPNDWDLELDATFEGSIPATLEPRHWRREFERVSFDTQRLAQTGRWTGHLRVGDESFDLSADRWWGYRDRSWGVRPVGEAEPPGIRASQPPGTFFWCYAPLQFDDHSLLFITQEDRDGSRIIEEAIRVWNDPKRPADHLGRPEHDVEFIPGTRAPRRAVLHMTETDGSPLDVTVDVVLPCYLLQGTGYGMDEDWRHGMWQGPTVKVEGRMWDLTDPAVRSGLFGLLENVATAKQSSGPDGMGMLEFACVGPHDKYGFEGWEDMGLVPPD
jgi:hypothetical protein